MKINKYIYHIVSIIKLFLWIFLSLIVYNYVNIYEDPAIWISLWFLWVFITLWGWSFFIFLWIQKIFRHESKIRIQKDSYKLSLLFWIFAMTNVLLLILWHWSKFLWFLLLIIFVLLQIFLFSKQNNK